MFNSDRDCLRRNSRRISSQTIRPCIRKNYSEQGFDEILVAHRDRIMEEFEYIEYRCVAQIVDETCTILFEQ